MPYIDLTIEGLGLAFSGREQHQQRHNGRPGPSRDGSILPTIPCGHPGHGPLHRRHGDDPPAALVERMARTFQDSDGDIAAVLRTLFTSPELAGQAGGPAPGEIETEGFGLMALDMGVQCWGLPTLEILHANE